METCWLYALLSAANKSVDNTLSIPLLLLVLPLSWGVSAALKCLKWPKAIPTVLSWIIWIPLMLLMVKMQLFWSISFSDTAWLSAIPQSLSHIFVDFESPFLILISTAALWWLGRRIAYLRPDFAAAIIETQLGLIILVIVFFTAYELKLEQSGSVMLALIFFFLALLGVSVSHSQGDSWLFSSRKSYWAGIVLVCIGIILALGLLIGFIFNPDLIQIFLKILKWIWTGIERVISWLANLFPSQNAPLPEMQSFPSLEPSDSEEIKWFSMPEWLRRAISLVWIIIVSGLLLVAIWRIATQISDWIRRHLPSRGGEVESLKGAFKADLLNLLKKIISTIFKIKFKSRAGDKIKNIPTQVMSVRQLYSQFLYWAAAEGYPRDKSQTPEEYRLKLSQLKPEYEEALGTITHEYMNVRYGSSVPTDAKLNQLREKWQYLRKQGLKKPKK